MTPVRYSLALLSILGFFSLTPSLTPIQAQTPTPPNPTQEAAPSSPETPGKADPSVNPNPQQTTPSPGSQETTSPPTPQPGQPQSGQEVPPAQSVEDSQRTEQISTSFGELEGLLKQQNWQAADQTNFDLMLAIAGPKSQEQGRFALDEWQNFSCDELKKIDSLWSQYSTGKLGFSAQKQVFERAQKNFFAFYGRIGWLDLLTGGWKVSWNYDQAAKKAVYAPEKAPDFSNPTQVEGYLPAILVWETDGDRRFEKIYACGL